MNKINKKVLFICFSLIILFIIGFYLLSDNNNTSEYETNYEFIGKYEANMYTPVRVNEKDMANKYLNDFKYLLMNDLDRAYEVINYRYRNKKYENIDVFKKNIEDEYSVLFYSMTVKEYSGVRKGDYNYYYIRNNRDDLYIFKELSIMNYEVFLDDYTVEVK